MLQRSLDFYFKQTKTGGNVNVKSTVEVTPKQRRRTVSGASRKVPAKLPRTTPIKSIFSASQRTPMKSNRPPDAIITLDDDEDLPVSTPTPSTSRSPADQPPGPSTSASSASKAQKTPSRRQRNVEMGKKNPQNSSKTPKSLKKQKILTQTPKYCISLDDSDEEFQQKSPPKPSNPIKNLEIPVKSPEKTPKNPTQKRSLRFTSCENPTKRQRINEIMSQEVTKENSFNGFALTTTTSKIESLEVSQIFSLEANKELSLFNKSQSFIKDELMLSEDEMEPEVDKSMELMLSEDEWDPEEVERFIEPLHSVPDAHNIQKSPPKTYLKILPPEMINRKFDSHQNSQKNSQNSDDDLQMKKSNKLKRIESEEILSENSPLRLDNISSKKSEGIERSFSDISEDFEVTSCPQTPKKINNKIMSLKTPERSPQSVRLSFPQDGVSQSPLNCLNTLGTPLKRSASTFSLTQMSPTKKNYRPRKIFKENTNFQTVVENLNLAKDGTIPMNDFDLEEIYNKGEFKFQWGTTNSTAAESYEVTDVVLPENKHSERLFEMIFWVFSEPANCGYFDEEERDLVFRMMSLSQDEQVLLAIMLKREIRWFRVKKQKFEKHFEGNMEGHLMKLAGDGFFDSDWTKVDIDIIFNLLQVDELKELCKRMKMSHTVAKPKMISSLKQLLRQNTSHFSTTSPREALKSRLTSVAGPILKLSDRFLSLIHRILTLYYPNANPEDSIADAFYLFSEVHYGNKIFPSFPMTRLPLFRNRQALNDYVEAKLVWSEMTQVMTEKNKGPSHWEEARRLGTQAYGKLTKLIQKMKEESKETDSNSQKSISDCVGLIFDRAGPSSDCEKSEMSKKRSKLPSHIGRFSATYVWSKVLFLSIEAFKKLKPDGYDLAKTYLEFLLDNRSTVPVNFGKIYKEITMIEMSHLKNLERSAELTIEAFSVTSSIIDQAEMMERARKLSSRVKGISSSTKERLKEILAEKEEQFLCLPKVETIEVTKLDREGLFGKSLWQLNIGDEEKGYGNVEDVALSHYANVGYPKGIHCEGALPVTLFACLFWKEIYELPVPGAFVSQFQREPLDLFGSNFYENRRDSFSRKFADLEGLEDFSQVWDTMTENYRDFSSLESIMQPVVGDSELFREIVQCLGKNGVVGICKKIILGGYVTWRSGFPDLFVWNDRTRKCKVVEVKGPGDSLSVKQKMWIKYLEEIGVKVEVCLVKAKQQC